MNYGIGASLLHKLEQANCPIASGGHVAKSIHQMQHTQHYHRQYAWRRAVRMHRMYSRLRRIKAYRHAKQRQRDIDVYKKGQLDLAPGISDVNKRKNTARVVYRIEVILSFCIKSMLNDACSATWWPIAEPSLTKSRPLIGRER